MPQPGPCREPGGDLALRLLPIALAAAPLVVLPGRADFARLPQQAFVECAALGLGLLWVAWRGAVPLSFGRRSLDIPLLALLGWSAVSLLGALDPGAGLRTLGHWAACAVVYVFTSRVARAVDVPRLAGAVLLGGAVAAAAGLGQALLGTTWIPQAAAPAATMANRNVAAGYVAAVVPLALLSWRCRPARVAAAVAAPVMLSFLPFARSRAAAAAVALQLFVLALTQVGFPTQGDRRRRAAVTACLTASLALVVAAAWVSLTDPEKSRSASIRWSLAGSAVSMACDRPVLGVGLGGFGAAYPSHGPVVTSASGAALHVESPHNEGLQVLAETGLPGLLCGLWLVGTAFQVVCRLRRAPDPATRRAALAIGLSLVGFAADAAFGFPLRYPVGPFVVAVLLGLLASLDAGGLRATAQPARRAGAVRLSAVAAATLALALSASSTLARLGDDRVLSGTSLTPVSEPALTPTAYRRGGSAPSPDVYCAPDVILEGTADGRLDLLARDAPLADVLQCLIELRGGRLEFDGPQPGHAVSVSLRGETLPRVVESVFEGLGVNYLLSLDPSGTTVDRLIVFAPTKGLEAPRAGRRSSSAVRGQALDLAPVELPGEPAVEPVIESFASDELTPLTLQLGRRPSPRVATTEMSSPP